MTKVVNFPSRLLDSIDSDFGVGAIQFLVSGIKRGVYSTPEKGVHIKNHPLPNTVNG